MSFMTENQTLQLLCGKTIYTENFFSSVHGVNRPLFWLPCSQGLSTHKQSDLFKLSISEFCYLITSGGQHIPLACELWRTFFMSEVDGGSGEELIINPQ